MPSVSIPSKEICTKKRIILSNRNQTGTLFENNELQDPTDVITTFVSLFLFQITKKYTFALCLNVFKQADAY